MSERRMTSREESAEAAPVAKREAEVLGAWVEENDAKKSRCRATLVSLLAGNEDCPREP